MGGKGALLHAAEDERIGAAVAFRPAPTTSTETARLKVPVQIHHGTADGSVAHTNSQELEKTLRAQGTSVELFLYENENHGFLAYTRPFYSPQSAQLAWNRCVEFLRKYLKG